MKLKCPKGHELPHETPNGQCTPLYCGSDGLTVDGLKRNGGKYKPRKKKEAVVGEQVVATSANVKDINIPTEEKNELRKELVGAERRVANEVISALPEKTEEQVSAQLAAADARAATIGRMGAGLGQFAVRQAFLKIPRGMNTEEAEQWAASKSVELLPAALGEVEFRLKYGNDDQRYEAALGVLDMNGMRKKEALNAGGNTLVVHLGNNPDPWAKKVVEGSVKKILLPEGGKE